MDIKQLAKALDVSEDIFIELIDAWIQSTGEDLQALDNSSQSADINKVIEHSHKIKGASSQLGFNVIAETAKKIEHDARAGSVSGLSEAVNILKNERNDIIKLKELYAGNIKN